MQSMLENRKKSVIHHQPLSQHLQFGELQREVSQLSAQNKKKYFQIIENRPHFNYQLIKVNQSKSVSLNFGRQLLMKQMDKLLEEESYLNRQLTLIRIEQEQSQKTRDHLIQNEVNSLEVMKTMWNSKNQIYENAVDHAEILNHTVGSIKLSIRRLIEKQKVASPDSDVQFMKNYQKYYQGECSKCKTQEQSIKKIKQQNQTLQEEMNHLNQKNRELQNEIKQKNDSIKRLNKKIIEIETETSSKVMYLEEKLLMEDHQIKQLRKFKSQLQKNQFKHENYQLYLKTDQDLTLLNKNVQIELDQLLDFIASRQENQIVYQQETEQKPQQSMNMQQMSPEQLMLELALPIGKTQPRKTALTDRPKSQRRRSAFNNTAMKLEQLDNIGKKYMRTNQLTTKRNKALAYTPMETKHTNSTLQFSDSPKSIEQGQ